MLYANVAMIRLAKLLGGDEGADMHAIATEELRARQVQNPRALADVLVPGFR